ncbi:YdiK family protein [Bacillus sp. 2205SS5-2]|uniref:YdiK family protein n=1 Tax=Bacillus sp. 2205SS5-2 TaxID=3109031 RepID=UPI00300402AE
MRKSPLFTGIIYTLLGILFTYFSIQNVVTHGWGFFTYLLIFLATLDLGSGLRMINIHIKLKTMQKK